MTAYRWKRKVNRFPGYITEYICCGSRCARDHNSSPQLFPFVPVPTTTATTTAKNDNNENGFDDVS